MQGLINVLQVSSTWLTVNMALGRYLAICRPILYRRCRPDWSRNQRSRSQTSRSRVQWFGLGLDCRILFSTSVSVLVWSRRFGVVNTRPTPTPTPTATATTTWQSVDHFTLEATSTLAERYSQCYSSSLGRRSSTCLGSATAEPPRDPRELDWTEVRF